MTFSIFMSCFCPARMEVKMVIVIFQEKEMSKASCDSKTTEKSGKLQVDTGAWKDPKEIRTARPIGCLRPPASGTHILVS